MVTDADRASRNAALVLALTGPADTLLYLLLPLYHEAFGVTLGEAGLLLAANRLVRLVGYGWVARLYARRGPRLACVLAACSSALAAAAYAVFSGFWLLLLARLVWGLCFAALNIATQALPTAQPSGAARRSGRARSLISVGLMIGLIGGACLAQLVGPRLVFLAFAAVALIALPIARRLPGPEAGAGDLASGPRFEKPTRLDLWSFLQALTLDGLFVLGLAVLATAAVPENAALAAGAALALRYLAEIVLAPVSGALGERLGPKMMLVILSLAASLGMALIGLGWLWVGAIIVVVVRGLLPTLAAPVAAAANPGSARVPALARLATWRDLGAGGGPLLAGLLLPIAPTGVLYGAAAGLVAAAALNLSRRDTAMTRS